MPTPAVRSTSALRKVKDREAEMEEMERKWKEQNERIMAETPQGEMEPLPASAEAASSDTDAADANEPSRVSDVERKDS